MSDFDRTQECVKNFHTLFKCDPFPKDCDDPQMMEILQKYIFGEVFATGSLSARERELITVTVLASLQTLPQLKAHLNAALNAGATADELHESLYQLAAFIGFPRTLNALWVFQEVLKARGLKLSDHDPMTVTEENRVKRGAALERELFCDDLKSALGSVPCGFEEKVHEFIQGFGLGDLFTRGGLELSERAMLAAVTLQALGNTASLERWSGAALRAGCTRERLVAAVIQAMPYTGFPAALEAFAAMKREFSRH